MVEDFAKLLIQLDDRSYHYEAEYGSCRHVVQKQNREQGSLANILSNPENALFSILLDARLGQTNVALLFMTELFKKDIFVETLLRSSPVELVELFALAGAVDVTFHELLLEKLISQTKSNGTVLSVHADQLTVNYSIVGKLIAQLRFPDRSAENISEDDCDGLIAYALSEFSLGRKKNSLSILRWLNVFNPSTKEVFEVRDWILNALQDAGANSGQYLDCSIENDVVVYWTFRQIENPRISLPELIKNRQ